MPLGPIFGVYTVNNGIGITDFGFLVGDPCVPVRDNFLINVVLGDRTDPIDLKKQSGSTKKEKVSVDEIVKKI